MTNDRPTAVCHHVSVVHRVDFSVRLETAAAEAIYEHNVSMSISPLFACTLVYPPRSRFATCIIAFRRQVIQPDALDLPLDDIAPSSS